MIVFLLFVVALAIGAAVNVYVVYRLAQDMNSMLGDPSLPRWSHGPDSNAWYWRERTARGVQQIDGLGTSRRVSAGQRGADRAMPPVWSTMIVLPTDGEVNLERKEFAVGWPYPALASRLERNAQTAAMGRPRPAWTIVDGREIPIEDPQRRMLATITGQIDVMPTRPIWGGLLLNSVLFALPVWLGCLLIAAIIAFGPRRWWRKKRGCCPRCAYDLRHDFATGCPECGWNRAAAASATP